MCEALQVPRSNFYYDANIAVQKQQEKAAEEQILKEIVLTIFNENRQVFGTRKIKDHLAKSGYTVSKRRIGRFMKELGLKSKHGQPSYKPMITKPNEDVAPNLLEQDFNINEPMSVLVSDLTYVRVGKQWNYVCFLIDLYNREIVGHSAGKHKDAALVQHAFANVKHPLETVKIFHTDRGSEFKNVGIDELLSEYSIQRSLSDKGNPYDNAVSETTFKILKTELINDMYFDTLEQLSL